MSKIILFLTALCLAQLSFAEEFNCAEGRTKHCKDMDSCREAKYYLNQCGIDRLDRDHDGVPCESICGNSKKR